MLCAATALATAALAAVVGAAPQGRDFAVVAYLPEWRYETVHWEELSQAAGVNLPRRVVPDRALMMPVTTTE